MTLRKREDLEIERGNTRWHYLEYCLWKNLRTSHKRHHMMIVICFLWAFFHSLIFFFIIPEFSFENQVTWNIIWSFWTVSKSDCTCLANFEQSYCKFITIRCEQIKCYNNMQVNTHDNICVLYTKVLKSFYASLTLFLL
jgi:hypothetical protein